MSRLMGWVGFFFFALSGFLPLISVNVLIAKFSVLSPVVLFSDILLGGSTLQEISSSSPTLLYIVLLTGIFYVLGIVLGFYGLSSAKKRGTFYGGVFGLAYSFLAFVSAYGILRFAGNPARVLAGAGVGVFSAFFGSVVMLYSAQRRGRRR